LTSPLPPAQSARRSVDGPTKDANWAWVCLAMSEGGPDFRFGNVEVALLTPLASPYHHAAWGVRAVARKGRNRSGVTSAPSPDGSQEETITTRVVVEDGDGRPIYINLVEISHSRHEFMMHCLQAPTRLTPTMREVIVSSGELRLSPIVTLLMPPTLLPGLIKALMRQMEKYEQQHGPIQKGPDATSALILSTQITLAS
jgi:hypothetical protein